MKPIAVLILMAVLAGANPSRAQDFYDIDTIGTLEIIFPESNWDQILDDLKAAGQEERHIGTAFINGVPFDSVGVRYKGNSSYDLRRIKNPLNIKLDHVIDDQTLDGYGTLKLANAYKDPSMIREVLSYEMARMIMPASRANFIKVTINGQYLGLYTSVQDVDKLFAETHFGSRDNVFFKGELLHEGQPVGNSIWTFFGWDSLAYSSYYELESDHGWAHLLDFLDVFNNDPGSMESVLNVDRHLWMLAFDNLMVNLDAPINFGHNYYLYRDDAGRFNPVMWDLNENFGVFVNLHSQMGPGGDLSVSEMQRMSPDLHADKADYPIVGQVLNDPIYWKRYVAHMKTMIQEFVESGWYMTRAQEIQAIIDEAVQNDPNKLYTYSDFKNNLTRSIGGVGFGGPGGGSIVGISELMEARVDYLLGLADFEAQAPAIDDVRHDVSGQSAWISAEVGTARSVQLAWRSNPVRAFEKVDMVDDGAHRDGAAGDGVYGVELTGVSGQIQYYIYAENSDACAFSPARVEYEFYSLTAAWDVVINEFMASNSTVAADEAGEFDDWIELYNNSASAVDLSGWTLSDKAGNLTKWAFPDTSIEAGGYLIVWADEDGSQGQMHANFKLSADGEALYLSDADGNLKDNISFGAQAEDVSLARSPNGTGEFEPMEATFEAFNTSEQSGVEDGRVSPSGFELAQNFPNPFNPETTVGYTLAGVADVELAVYNLQGQRVRILVRRRQNAGRYQAVWDGTDENGARVASGVYICRIVAGNQRAMRKMNLMK